MTGYGMMTGGQVVTSSASLEVIATPTGAPFARLPRARAHPERGDGLCPQLARLAEVARAQPIILVH